MRYPLKHVGIKQGFRNTGLKKHYGIDLGWNDKYGGKHAPVYAIADGEVIYFKYQTTGGYTIRIKHFDEKDSNGNIFYSEYGHLQKGSIKVKVGQRVKMGEQIANMGNTGICSAWHLHLTIYKGSYSNANKVDPLKYLCLYKNQSAGADTLKNYKIYKTKVVTGTDGTLAIRNKPSSDGKRVAIKKEGSEVESFGVTKGWNIVDNINGYYCSNKYLK